jgi:hypothetical protein
MVTHFFIIFLEMNGCNGEGNLLACNKYCPELGLPGMITRETKLWYFGAVSQWDRYGLLCSPLLLPLLYRSPLITVNVS